MINCIFALIILVHLFIDPNFDGQNALTLICACWILADLGMLRMELTSKSAKENR